MLKKSLQLWLLPVIALLCLLAVRTFQLRYQSETKRLSEQVAYTIDTMAQHVQNQNLTLNNLLYSLDDKEHKEKVAFAIGMTGNTARMQIGFGENDVRDSSVPFVDRAYLKRNNIVYKPGNVKHISHFNSLLHNGFRNSLPGTKYHIIKVQMPDTNGRAATGYITRPFIINYYDPVVYRVRYYLPMTLVLRSMGSYIAANLLLLLLIVAATAFAIKAYKQNMQMALFRENMFGNMVHELKTPVTSLQLIMEAAGKTGDATAPKTLSNEHYLFAGQELQRINQIIEKALSFGKLDKLQFALNREKTDLGNTINHAITMMAPTITACNAVVHFTRPDNSIMINGDSILLSNAIAALIDNAMKYNNRQPEIQIALQWAFGNAIITITDNGIGIDKTYRKKIFTPFFRIPTGNVHNVKGHGLGLSFVMQVARLHSGTITIMPVYAGGSAFTIKIPC